MLKLDGSRISLAEFCKAVSQPTGLQVGDTILDKIIHAHQVVQKIAVGDEPVYGLNTGLGGNLGFRLKPDEISDFQMQIIKGRAVACGEPLPEKTGRGILLARIISAAQGYSGISLELFEHLIAVYDAGISPVVPEYGSIGDSDLVQNSHFALAIIGEGDVWFKGGIVSASAALNKSGLTPPTLKPKEGLAMVSHSGLTTTLTANALLETQISLEMAKSTVVMSYEGYGANQKVLDDEINSLRHSPCQLIIAQWLRKNLKGSEQKPRRIQEALSFRTVPSVLGAAQHALDHSISVWEDEANGASDSPVILENGEMFSTANFHTPALALAIEGISLALSGVANGSVQRMQRIMNPELSGLPKYLSTIGGGSAGFVPSQKTASALNTEIRHGAIPIIFNPAPISDGVEDMAPNTPATTKKLSRQLHPFKLLFGLEALVACQALDLRKPDKKSPLTTKLYKAIRAEVPMLIEDRPLGQDINTVTKILFLTASNFAD